MLFILRRDPNSKNIAVNSSNTSSSRSPEYNNSQTYKEAKQEYEWALSDYEAQLEKLNGIKRNHYIINLSFGDNSGQDKDMRGLNYAITSWLISEQKKKTEIAKERLYRTKVKLNNFENN